MRHPNQHKGAVARQPAQDLNRHTARAAANHLSTAELVKRDAANVAEDAAKLDRLPKSLKPPHIHRYEAGKCCVCEAPDPYAYPKAAEGSKP
jgi:hypothetical protein